MAKSSPAPAQAVTANALRSGAVVFLRDDGEWSPDVAGAAVARAPGAADALLRTAMDAAAANVVVEPYLIDVVEGPGGPVPTKYRERIRSGGPTARYGPSRPADG